MEIRLPALRFGWVWFGDQFLVSSRTMMYGRLSKVTQGECWCIPPSTFEYRWLHPDQMHLIVQCDAAVVSACS